MNTSNSKALPLELACNRLSAFFPLLQQGVGLQVTVGRTIKQMLCQELGISPDYVDGSINTIFLNGNPVDQVDGAQIDNGDTLALSAAMPGLAGATLRKGGVLAPFRSSISYARPQSCGDACSGTVVIKLFNMVLKDLGPGLLAYGIVISRERLDPILERCNLPEDCPGGRLDNVPVDGRQLRERLEVLDGKHVRLRVVPVV